MRQTNMTTNKTITVKRSHGTVGQPENDKWIATLHLGGGGWGYYGNSAKEAEAGLRANEHRCEGVKAKVTDKPLFKLSSEPVGTGRNKVTRWVTTPITFEDGTPLVTDDQGLIVTAPITEPSTPLVTDENGTVITEPTIITSYDRKPIPTNKFDWLAHYDGCEEYEVGNGATEAEAITDLRNIHCYEVYDPTWNGFKKDVTPEDIKGLVLSCIGMLFLIAIFAAAEVTK